MRNGARTNPASTLVVAAAAVAAALAARDARACGCEGGGPYVEWPPRGGAAVPPLTTVVLVFSDSASVPPEATYAAVPAAPLPATPLAIGRDLPLVNGCLSRALVLRPEVPLAPGSYSVWMGGDGGLRPIDSPPFLVDAAAPYESGVTSIEYGRAFTTAGCEWCSDVAELVVKTRADQPFFVKLSGTGPLDPAAGKFQLWRPAFGSPALRVAPGEACIEYDVISVAGDLWRGGPCAPDRCKPFEELATSSCGGYLVGASAAEWDRVPPSGACAPTAADAGRASPPGRVPIDASPTGSAPPPVAPPPADAAAIPGPPEGSHAGDDTERGATDGRYSGCSCSLRARADRRAAPTLVAFAALGALLLRRRRGAQRFFGTSAQ